MLESFWMKEAFAHDTETSAPLDGDTRFDVCVVGGGYTGLWTALRIKEASPGTTVAIVEAEHCGAGGSGANAGFVAAYWAHFPTFQRLAGTDEAIRLCRAAAEVSHEIERLALDHGFDVQLMRNGTIWGATCEAQMGGLEASMDALEKQQEHPYQRLNAEEIEALTGVTGYLGGVLETDNCTVQPGLLVRGLRRVAISAGVHIFEHTPMTRLHRTTPPKVETPTGTITADKVVLALYAWSARIPELRDSLVVVNSDAILTREQPEAVASVGWQNGPALMDSNNFTEGIRTTVNGRVHFNKAGGRLVYGGRIDTSLTQASRPEDSLKAGLAERFPTLAATKIEHQWNGPIDRTREGLPKFGHLPTCANVLYGFGYSGRGMAPTALGGRILAALALELDDEWSRSALVQPLNRDFPPEPLKYFGGLMVQAAIERKDRYDQLDVNPDPLTRALFRLKPGHWSRR